MFPANNLDQFFIKYFEELNTKSWTLIPTEIDFILKLQNSAKTKFNSGLFKDAAVTHSQTPLLSIRNDQIFWLDQQSKQPYGKELKARNSTIDLNTSLIENLALEHLGFLTEALKNFFRISLTELECHFAVYKPGHYYQKHIDSTSHNNKRIFSFVIYLNENWAPTDGGQLTGYHHNEKIFEIFPEAGHMVLFKSDLEHEVLKTHRERYSLTGWIRS